MLVYSPCCTRFRVCSMIYLNKAHYQEKSVFTSIDISRLQVQGSYKAKGTILKNPVTFAINSDTTFTVVLREKSHDRLVSNALVEY